MWGLKFYILGVRFGRKTTSISPTESSNGYLGFIVQAFCPNLKASLVAINNDFISDEVGTDLRRICIKLVTPM